MTKQVDWVDDINQQEREERERQYASKRAIDLEFIEWARKIDEHVDEVVSTAHGRVEVVDQGIVFNTFTKEYAVVTTNWKDLLLTEDLEFAGKLADLVKEELR